MAMKNNIQDVTPSIRKRIEETHARILSTLDLHGRDFTLRDICGHQSDAGRLLETGAVTRSIRKRRIHWFTWKHDREESERLIHAWLDAFIDLAIDRDLAYRAKKNLNRKTERIGPIVDDHAPVVKKSETGGTIYQMSRARHWESTGTRGTLRNYSTLGASNIFY